MPKTLKAYKARFMRALDRLDDRMHDSLGRSRMKIMGDKELHAQAMREVRLSRLNTQGQGGTPVVRLGKWWD